MSTLTKEGLSKPQKRLLWRMNKGAKLRKNCRTKRWYLFDSSGSSKVADDVVDGIRALLKAGPMHSDATISRTLTTLGQTIAAQITTEDFE